MAAAFLWIAFFVALGICIYKLQRACFLSSEYATQMKLIISGENLLPHNYTELTTKDET